MPLLVNTSLAWAQVMQPSASGRDDPFKHMRRTSLGLWNCTQRGASVVVKACFFNPREEPLLKEALKEPVAFMGGILAGLLRLDLDEDPLKEWVTRTVEAAGITDEEIDVDGSKADEEVPQQIDIE
ncbi:UPF0426 protein At1g28150, chloroplastic isoform X3 [Tripterygium wilfordii]|uniref:UPF0426 protein At1g28150, chloroplastic isoform X3 n=1 Tax=Tripterygium wilfordii TaxID=458696 RepID=UPI0018F7EE64|nr:UPF0426 protein At1g28150, chloroplastic isoform X3 [Tripterygium wilfordii]